MQWEELTSADFAKAVQETGVCVIALGVVEKHGDHLPLGTDYLNGQAIACRAAEIEPAVVFPPFYFGQIYEARCFPGTITIAPRLLFDLVQGVFDEIGRNGFKKIVVLNAHGGNSAFLPFLAQCALWEEKPYSIYIPQRHLSPERETEWEEMAEAPYGGHGGERESSLILGTYSDLARMDRVEGASLPRGRMKGLPPTYSGIWWYADYPEHYAGDARVATREKGEKLLQWEAEYLAEYIAAVKADEVIPALREEFFRRVREVGA
ncbi:MAG TPA: creatininase family protein [Chloroflexi bacterium]|nr:creatininase family protein [Chloroflexota bacterium]